MKRWTIYCHTHVDSGRRYVGLTSQTMERRWTSHCSKAKSSKGGRWHFPNAIRRYGKEAFSHHVIMVLDSIDPANAWEEFWIDFLDTRNPGHGFNLAPGGQHIPHLIRKNPWDDPGYRSHITRCVAAMWDDPIYRSRATTASREVNSRPEVRQKMRQANTGRTLDVASCAKISERRALQVMSMKQLGALTASRSDPEVIARRRTSLKEYFHVRANADVLRVRICKKHGEMSLTEFYKVRSNRVLKGVVYLCKRCSAEKRKRRTVNSNRGAYAVPEGDTMTETKGIWDRLKGALVEDVPSAAKAGASTDAPAVQQRNTPLPPLQRNTPLPPPPQEIDAAVRQKLEAAIAAGSPPAIVTLQGTLTTLAAAIPDEPMRFKTAVNLAIAQGHSASALIGDVDVCIGILDKKKDEFEAAGQKTMRSAVDEREKRAADISGTVAEKRRQINQLSAECEQLEAEERQVVADATAERQRISAVSQGFTGAYDAVKRNLAALRSKLAAAAEGNS